ncbi:MAG TPA: tetratricopeptide repeat protein [Candidatus Acidoferrales bacterium]|nr:tetratricopeptide repeat protein [Candidatus Acidoferrales bacterium]
MAFNKNKALESALKYLNQGKVAQAISEYRQILRHDPKDQATLMTVGDLYARQGDMPNAIEYFERLAQVYLSDGFNSKAIAIYKKIAKLAPNELAPLERLADLYVQQGVLSEARPLYLQIAEAHLKANRAPKAVEALHRLLEVEPESPRVQMRLAELYGVLGQKKEAAETYLNYGQRLLDRGEADEAEKLAERAISVDGTNAAALLLKGKSLVALHRTEQAIAAFEQHPDADAGGEVTNLIIDLELKAGQIQKVADRARNQLLRGSSHCGLLHRVADALIESGHAAQALPLLAELRDPMIEAGEQDKYVKSLSAAAERLPGSPEPLETLADFCRTTSDPFRLNSALTQLAEIYSASGDHVRLERVTAELIDRNKDDERLADKLNGLRAQGRSATPVAHAPEPEEQESPASVPFVDLHPEPEPKKERATPVETEAPAAVREEPIDEDTQRFISQALTDVDLFSSYGLTQKATHLLETVLERAPRHTPTLERLLDFYLGAGNERRTAELASQLEQIYTQRGDTQNAERFSELRVRFQTAAGMTEEELPAAPALPSQPAASASASVETPSAPAPVHREAPAPAAVSQASPAEFEIPVVSLGDEHEAAAQQASPAPVAAASHPVAPTSVAQPAEFAEEVDLSDEWEAMLKDSDAPTAEATEEVPAETASGREQTAPAPPPPSAHEDAAEFVIDADAQPEAEHEFTVAPAAQDALDPIVEASPEVPAESHTAATPAEEFDFELVEEAKPGKAGAQSTDDLINELVAELDDMAPPTPPESRSARSSANGASQKPQRPVSEVVAAGSLPPGAHPPPPAPSSSVPPVTAEALNQLSEVFQEFRNEFGEESSDENEDLETHYNLGIAYREMGLLDEAIGEFQKVAKAIQKGKAFAYAMNCSTLLALSFADKGEPKIAALWYQRALETPGLDQEATLALRYDLGVSLEQAGESNAALDSFRQVYAMNIDYRDVADRIATLQHR